MIVPNAALNCNGRITNVAVSMEVITPPRNNIPLFQVWHPTLSNSSNYTIIGEVQLSAGIRMGNDATRYSLTNMSLNSNNQIEFQSGDVIGYYQPSDSQRLIWNIQTSGYTSYSNTVTSPLTSIDTDNVDNIETDRQPLIEIIFGKSMDTFELMASSYCLVITTQSYCTTYIASYMLKYKSEYHRYCKTRILMKINING